MTSLASLAARRLDPCGHRQVQAGCGECDERASWQFVDGRLVPAP